MGLDATHLPLKCARRKASTSSLGSFSTIIGELSYVFSFPSSPIGNAFAYPHRRSLGTRNSWVSARMTMHLRSLSQSFACRVSLTEEEYDVACNGDGIAGDRDGACGSTLEAIGEVGLSAATLGMSSAREE